jgi:hypothetical protein
VLEILELGGVGGCGSDAAGSIEQLHDGDEKGV